MPPRLPEPRYVANIVIRRTIDYPAEMNARGYPEGGKPARTETETFEVPAVKANEIGRLREKVGDYMNMVSDEDFGDPPGAVPGQ